MKRISTHYLIACAWLITVSCSSNNRNKGSSQTAAGDSTIKTTNVAITHHFGHFLPGDIINHIPCTDGKAQTFCLYLPHDYDTTKAWPVIYFFDAHARGKLPVTKYKDLAEKYHVILVGSNNSQNGLATETYDHIAQVLFTATQTVLNISPTNIIAAGFSGGGKVAAMVAMKNSAISSVISCGAGLEMNKLGSSYFNYVSIVGKGDFNYWDMVETDQQLNSTPLKHLLLTFDGIHEWPDVETMSTAIDFAMNPSKNKPSAAVDASLAQKEKETRDGYAKAFQTQDATYWFDVIEKLNNGFKNAKNPDEKWMNRRLLSFINMMTYMHIADLLNNKQLDAARSYLAVFKASDPKNPDGPYLTADWYALSGDRQGAYSALDDAVKMGYDDFAHFSTDPMLISMQNDRGYQNIYEKLRK